MTVRPGGWRNCWMTATAYGSPMDTGTNSPERGVTKEAAILKACAACGIGPEEITAFGDDYADMGMLRLCGRGIAMGNALDVVKEAADIVIGSNDEDGIAVYLESLME